MRRILLTTICLIGLAGCNYPVTEVPTKQQQTSSQSVVPKQQLVPSEVFAGATITGSSIARFLTSSTLVIGDIQAPTTLTVFTNYECAYCNQFFRDQYPQLENQFVQSGQLQVQIIPKVVQKYEQSTLAAKALHCAGIANRGYEFHQALVKKEAITSDTLTQAADDASISIEEFNSCRNNPELDEKISRQQSVIDRLEVDLIPTFYIGKDSIVGLPTYIDLAGFINLHLPESSESSTTISSSTQDLEEELED